MSGIAGMLTLDRRGFIAEHIRDMVADLRSRGPQGEGTWISDSIALGHTWLRTTEEMAVPAQPFTLDGRAYITSDARVDGREQLVADLRREGENLDGTVCDAALILHAYRAWGDRCVDHLLGDFSFSIWDRERRLLFCARDRFGVRPFYYTRAGGIFAWSSSLHCLRRLPQVSGELNDTAIADFLLFGCNQESSTTAFRDILRLPPAHTLTWSQDRLSIRRYWQIPEGERIRYHRRTDYINQLSELLHAAVADRLRMSRASVWMSGGLDSSTVAATAQRSLSRLYGSHELRAQTAVYDQLIPDVERPRAAAVAQHLGIGIDFLIADHYTLFRGFEAIRSPEPLDNALARIRIDLCHRAAAFSPIILTGEGPDALTAFHFQPYFLGLARRGNLLAAIRSLGHYVSAHRFRTPELALRERWRRLKGDSITRTRAPEWLDNSLLQRIEAFLENKRAAAQVHENGNGSLSRRLLAKPEWQSLIFERYQPENIGATVEICYPYFDARIVEFFASIPPVPWHLNKRILREVAARLLPQSVAWRPKTLLRGLPELELAKAPAPWFTQNLVSPELGNYVDIDRFSQNPHAVDYQTLLTDLRALSLNYWLTSIRTDARSFHDANRAPEAALRRSQAG